ESPVLAELRTRENPASAGGKARGLEDRRGFPSVHDAAVQEMSRYREEQRVDQEVECKDLDPELVVGETEFPANGVLWIIDEERQGEPRSLYGNEAQLHPGAEP